ncbi:SusC/RagA family TonB-linked outer membrane protein, partial [Aquimarina sp. AD1]
MKQLHYFMLLLFTVGITMGQELTITGTVTDTSNNDPIPGVNITIKGTNKGAQTDFDGRYSIQTNIGNILTFSFIGYETEEVKIKQDSSIVNVAMSISPAQLEEVVVTAQGIQRKRSVLGYAVSAVSSESISMSRADRRKARRARKQSKANKLNGRVSGLSITNNAGNTNSNNSIRIRGANSISNTNQPLYIVDGIPIDKKNIGKIQSIDPKNISN